MELLTIQMQNFLYRSFPRILHQDNSHQIVQLYVQNVHFHVQSGCLEQVLAHSKLQLHVSIGLLNNLVYTSMWNCLCFLVYYAKMFILDVCGKTSPWMCFGRGSNYSLIKCILSAIIYMQKNTKA